ncbi:MAG: hypothetical protein EPGJADBJ_00962 [Saprospiraceae bacterium]|nr:hypothetical protein [Saprospiraceae bacterium]
MIRSQFLQPSYKFGIIPVLMRTNSGYRGYLCYFSGQKYLVIGYWLLVVGYWLLVVGYWWLVIGDW